MKTANQTNQQTFIPLGEGFARKGQTIYFRVQTNGRATWRSTKTNELPRARKWKEKFEHVEWLRKEGMSPKEEAKPRQQTEGKPLLVDDLIDSYIRAGHPILKKRAIRAKSPRSIKNEVHSFRPVRKFFGRMPVSDITLGSCDDYYSWRLAGGYVAQFSVRSKPVTRVTKGGHRAVDLELTFLSNAFQYAVRRGVIKTNPLKERGEFADPANVRHCREVAPTPEGLSRIVEWMRQQGFDQDAEIALFLAYSGLRLQEGLNCHWSQIDWADELIHVKRSKKGVFPFVLILPEMAALLKAMQPRSRNDFLFPSPLNPNETRDESWFRRRLALAARKLGLPHVTPHGLRSYFVTQARQSGLTDAEIAQLIGDKSGPALIAQVYGDVRPDHLLAVARKIQLTAKTRNPQSFSNN